MSREIANRAVAGRIILIVWRLGIRWSLRCRLSIRRSLATAAAFTRVRRAVNRDNPALVAGDDDPEPEKQVRGQEDAKCPLLHGAEYTTAITQSNLE